VIFSALLASIPAGFQGSGEEPDTIIPIDPSIITGFSDTENIHRDNYSALGGGLYYYDYEDLGSRDWRTVTDDDTYLQIAAKVYVLGFLFFGIIEYCNFEAPDGTNRGPQLSFDEIDADAEDGAVRYSLTYVDTGDTAGSFVIYWDTTANTNSRDAWFTDDSFGSGHEDEGLYLLHGVGFDATATTNIAALLVSLLLLQLHEVPTLINILLAAPIWACIIFVLWYVIKEMIPFV